MRTDPKDLEAAIDSARLPLAAPFMLLCLANSLALRQTFDV